MVVALVFGVVIVAIDLPEDLGGTTTGERRADSDSGPEGPSNLRMERCLD